jgi:uncharacterized protein (DUF2345 family)
MAVNSNKVLALTDVLQGAEGAELEQQIGDFKIELHREDRGGTLVLTPPSGQALEITIEGDRLSLQYTGPRIEISAPEAAIEFSARTIELKAEESVIVHGGKEVDIHSGVDVEVRADHHVNLWGHNVLVGD